MKYKLNDVCASEVEFDIVDGRVRKVSFADGCSGNLKALSALLEGMPLAEVVAKLKGISCGENTTSCSDQLAKVLENLNKNK